MLAQVIYSSRAALPMGSRELETILEDARTGNAQRDITGALVYVDGVFFQVLEGPRDTVDELVRSIEDDARHHSMKVFYRADVGSRSFPSWRMAYLSPSAAEVAAWTGLEGTGTIKELLAELQTDSAQPPKILLSILSALNAHVPRGGG